MSPSLSFTKAFVSRFCENGGWPWGGGGEGLIRRYRTVLVERLGMMGKTVDINCFFCSGTKVAPW